MKYIFTIVLFFNFHFNCDAQTNWGNYMGHIFYLGNNTGFPAQNNVTVIDKFDNWYYLTLYPNPGFTFGIKKDKTLWAIGRSNFGYNFNYPDSFVKIDTSKNWWKLSATYTNAAALKTDSTLWTYGDNGYGASGHFNNYFTKRTNYKWKSISAGGLRMYAVKNDGTLWGAGWLVNSNLVKLDSSSDFKEVYSTYNGDSYALTKDGVLWRTPSINHPWTKKYPFDSSATWQEIFPSNFSSECIGLKKDGTLFYIKVNGTTRINSSIRNWTFITTGSGSNSTNYGIDQKYNLYSWSGNDTPLFSELSKYKNIGFLKQNGNGGIVGMFTDKLWKSSGASSNYSSLASLSFINYRSKYDSIIILNQTTVNSKIIGFDNILVTQGGTLKLDEDFQCNNIHLKNGTINLNGHKLTVTGRIYQSTDSANYFIQAGTSASPKSRSELAIKPNIASNSTVYFNPNANRLSRFEVGNGSAAAQITLGNSLKIKGGEDGGSGPGLLTVNKYAKIVIPSGSILTLESDTFNAGLSLAQPAQRSIVCTGTGKFNIERDHYGVRGWRLYSHPFKTDIDLQEVANDIELIGPGGTAEGFYSNTYTNAAGYWYDYSKADSSASTDPAWTPFTSAKGSTLSGNTNKWSKHSTMLLFNPGNRRGTGAFDNPSTATYEQGKITLSYTLDSTVIHLNDGTTQTISTGILPSKSKYFFITNPFTTPVKLCGIQGLNSSNVDPYFYYWKQRRNTVTDNFSPAEWQSEKIVVGNNTRDSNTAIPAFGTILVRLKNSSSITFTIPESAKQLTNFGYIIGGAKGVSKTGLMFADATGSDIGSNGIEIKLLVNDSQEADRVLVYNEAYQSPAYTNYDAAKYLNQDFPNVYTLSADNKPLSIDMQDIKAQLDAGQPEVVIPLGVNREANKRFATLKWELSENTTGLGIFYRNRDNGSTELWTVGNIKSVSFPSDASEIRNYELVFKRSTSSTEELTKQPIVAKRAPIELIVYPNPVDEKLMLKVINSNGEIPFYVYSITGVKVLEGMVKSEKAINTASLDAGVYVIDANGVLLKFIKEK
jgi:hypothetical protein